MSPMRTGPFAKKTSSNCSTQEQIRGQQGERRQWKQSQGQLKRRKLVEPGKERAPLVQVRTQKNPGAQQEKREREEET